MEAYQIKIILRDHEPKVWRQLIIPADFDFFLFHKTVNIAMGWSDYGTHKFVIPRKKIIIEEKKSECQVSKLDIYRVLDEDKTKLWDLAGTEGPVYYQYDSDKSWCHEIVKEEHISDYKDMFPTVIASVGECPPEEDEPREKYDKNVINRVLSNIMTGSVRLGFADEYEKSKILSLEKDNSHALGYRESLTGYTVDRVFAICGKWGLEPQRGCTKADMIHMLGEKVLDKETLRKELICTTNEEMELMEDVWELDVFADEVNENTVAGFFMDRGLFYISEDGEFTIPGDIHQIYESINSVDFKKSRWKNALLMDYCRAAANLYGIVPFEKIKEIFNKHNKSPAQDEDIERAVKGLLLRDEDVTVEERTLMQKHLSGDREKCKLEREQDGKPYYIPGREEFLKYAGGDNYKNSIPLERLVAYLINVSKEDAEYIRFFCGGLQMFMHLGCDKDLLISEVKDKMNVEAPGTLAKVEELLRDLWNDTRMISNRGFTPNELAEKSRIIPSNDNIISFPVDKK